MGWAQNTSELAYERGGPDRWLSTYLVVENWLREHADSAAGERGALLLGDVVARWWALRQLSLSVARMIDRGEAPARRVGARQGDGHPLRAGRARAGAPARGPRAVARRRRRCSSGCSRGRSSPVRRSRSAAGRSRSCARWRRRGWSRDRPAARSTPPTGSSPTTCTHEAVQDAERDGWAPDGVAGRRRRRLPVGVDRRGRRRLRWHVDRRRRHRRASPAATPRRSRWPRPGCSAAGSRRRPGLPLPDGPVTVVPGHADDTLALSGGTVSGRAVTRGVGPRGRARRRTAGRRRRLGGGVDSDRVRRPSSPAPTSPASPGTRSSSTAPPPTSRRHRPGSTRTRCASGARSRGR